MTEPTTEVISMDAPNTTSINRDLKYELAATVAQMFAKQREKKAFDKKINEEIETLKNRAADLVVEIESGGTQLAMNFATKADPSTIEEPEESDEDTDEDEQEH